MRHSFLPLNAGPRNRGRQAAYPRQCQTCRGKHKTVLTLIDKSMLMLNCLHSGSFVSTTSRDERAGLS